MEGPGTVSAARSGGERAPAPARRCGTGRRKAAEALFGSATGGGECGRHSTIAAPSGAESDAARRRREATGRSTGGRRQGVRPEVRGSGTEAVRKGFCVWNVATIGSESGRGSVSRPGSQAVGCGVAGRRSTTRARRESAGDGRRGRGRLRDGQLALFGGRPAMVGGRDERRDGRPGCGGTFR